MTSPAHGSATVSGNTVTFTPVAGYSGSDSFVWHAANSGGTSADATVSLTVSAPTLSLSPASGSLPSATAGTAWVADAHRDRRHRPLYLEQHGTPAGHHAECIIGYAVRNALCVGQLQLSGHRDGRPGCHRHRQLHAERQRCRAGGQRQRRYSGGQQQRQFAAPQSFRRRGHLSQHCGATFSRQRHGLRHRDNLHARRRLFRQRQPHLHRQQQQRDVSRRPDFSQRVSVSPDAFPTGRRAAACNGRKPLDADRDRGRRHGALRLHRR
ncbi:hypothetical protein K4732_20740 (plasmid) [Pantoea ananatis]|nr:hypothetical protein K4732_20740 [Pantoea ananatis]